jgi:hypothetical protein
MRDEVLGSFAGDSVTKVARAKPVLRPAPKAELLTLQRLHCWWMKQLHSPAY